MPLSHSTLLFHHSFIYLVLCLRTSAGFWVGTMLGTAQPLMVFDVFVGGNEIHDQQHCHLDFLLIHSSDSV